MTIREVLRAVTKEMWDRQNPTHEEARVRILELFKENGISESEYEPWMCNNVLPSIALK